MPPTLTPATLAYVRREAMALRRQIRAFDRKTEADSYTDTGEAWEYLHACEKLLLTISQRLA